MISQLAIALAVGAAIGLSVGAAIGRWITKYRARAEMYRRLSLARADMHREVVHWQEAAARATAEAARIAREADAYKAGHKSGREDVISIMPLLVAAQQRPADEAEASGEQG